MFAICERVGRWRHPRELIAELSLEELAEWMAYCDDHPAGHDARDLQQEIFRIRLLMGFDGKIGEAPNWQWPYIEQAPSLAEIRQAQAATRRAVEARERGQTPDQHG